MKILNNRRMEWKVEERVEKIRGAIPGKYYVFLVWIFLFSFSDWSELDTISPKSSTVVNIKKTLRKTINALKNGLDG